MDPKIFPLLELLSLELMGMMDLESFPLIPIGPLPLRLRGLADPKACLFLR